MIVLEHENHFGENELMYLAKVSSGDSKTVIGLFPIATSGTSGTPKLARYSLKSVIAVIEDDYKPKRNTFGAFVMTSIGLRDSSISTSPGCRFTHCRRVEQRRVIS